MKLSVLNESDEDLRALGRNADPMQLRKLFLHQVMRLGHTHCPAFEEPGREHIYFPSAEVGTSQAVCLCNGRSGWVGVLAHTKPHNMLPGYLEALQVVAPYVNGLYIDDVSGQGNYKYYNHHPRFIVDAATGLRLTVRILNNYSDVTINTMPQARYDSPARIIFNWPECSVVLLANTDSQRSQSLHTTNYVPISDAAEYLTRALKYPE